MLVKAKDIMSNDVIVYRSGVRDFVDMTTHTIEGTVRILVNDHKTSLVVKPTEVFMVQRKKEAYA
jgi:hypothetical protein